MGWSIHRRGQDEILTRPQYHILDLFVTSPSREEDVARSDTV